MTLDKGHMILGGICIALAIVLAVIVTHWLNSGKAAPAQGFQPTVEMKETKDIPRVKEQMTVPLETLVKKAVEEKVKGLPVSITSNPDARYTATAEIKPNEGKTDVVSVTDMKTGKTELIAHQEAPALFGLPNKKVIGARYGISAEGTVYDLHAQWDVLRIWVFNLGPYVEASYYPTATHDKARGRAMLQVEARW
jgi:hypothetical protein